MKAAYWELLRLFPSVQQFKDESGAVVMTEHYLRETVNDAHAAGVDTIIIPYVEYFGHWFYPRATYPEDFDAGKNAGAYWHDAAPAGVEDFNPLTAILDQAEQNGQVVFFGLGRNGDTPLLGDIHTVNTGGADPWRYGLSINARLGRAVDQTKQVAADLWSLYGTNPAFGGWYLSHEVSHLATANNYLMAASYSSGPDGLRYYGKPIIAAPAHTHDIGSLSAINDLLISGVDIFAPQDAVGAGYSFANGSLTFNPAVTLPQLPSVYQAWLTAVTGVNNWLAANGHTRRLTLLSTTELWQMDGPSYANDYPASPARVAQQQANSSWLTHGQAFYAWLGMVDSGGNSLTPQVLAGDPTTLFNYLVTL